MYDNTDAQIRDDVEEEVTAQYFGAAITRGSIDEFLKAEGEETVRTEKIGFLEKLKEIFKRIAAALQKKLEELAKKDIVAASVMQADVKELQKAVETFDAVLESVKDLSAARTGSVAASAERAEGADENKKSRMQDAGTIRYARMLEGNYDDIVDSVLSVSDADAIRYHNEGDVVQISEHTPVELLELLDDLEDHPLIIRYDALYLETRRNGVYIGPKAHYHNLGPKIMKQVGRIISQPYAILTQDTGYYNIIAPFPGLSDNGLISVDFGAVRDLIDKGHQKYNVVVNAFNPKKAFYDIKKTKNKPDDIFHFTGIVYKKENLSQVNPQLLEWLDSINERLSKDNILQPPNESQEKKTARWMRRRWRLLRR